MNGTTNQPKARRRLVQKILGANSSNAHTDAEKHRYAHWILSDFVLEAAIFLGADADMFNFMSVSKPRKDAAGKFRQQRAV